jgi:hypothetical protein
MLGTDMVAGVKGMKGAEKGTGTTKNVVRNEGERS